MAKQKRDIKTREDGSVSTRKGRGLPQYWSDTTEGDLSLNFDDKHYTQFEADMRAATGVQTDRLYNHLIGQVANVLTSGQKSKRGTAIDRSMALLYEIAPANALEGLLAMQMVGIHNVAMEMLTRSMLTEQPSAVVDQCITRATKLHRTFLQQLEALQKLRGQTGQQKMTVEHVHVHEGGQAIVGNVGTKGDGGTNET